MHPASLWRLSIQGFLGPSQVVPSSYGLGEEEDTISRIGDAGILLLNCRCHLVKHFFCLLVLHMAINPERFLAFVHANLNGLTSRRSACSVYLEGTRSCIDYRMVSTAIYS